MTERSYLKWAGGKFRSVDRLLQLFPKKFNVYYEPFLGSGVVFFNLNPEKAVLSDLCAPLMRTHNLVKTHLPAVWDYLSGWPNDEQIYYGLRNEFNQINLNNGFNPSDAAKFIYLNRLGYNGLYRVNSRGKFNVPFGRYSNNPHQDLALLQRCKARLCRANVLTEDFTTALERPTKGDFVYLDPPYYKEEDNSFVSYTKTGFDEADHITLKECCDKLDKAGVWFAVSNSNTQFVRKLYSPYYRHKVYTTRSVSAGNNRGQHTELLISNFSE